MSYDRWLMDGEGRNPYDLYDGDDGLPFEPDEDEEDDGLPEMVEVVYCKHCKWHATDKCMWRTDIDPFQEDFCSFGERR